MLLTIRRQACHRAHWAARLLMALAITAMAGRALVAPGYMATVEGDRISITLCGSGANLVLDLGDHDGPGGNDTPPDSACVFATTAVFAPAPVAVASIAAPVPAPEVRERLLPQAVAIGHGLAAPPPPSHAPPILV